MSIKKSNASAQVYEVNRTNQQTTSSALDCLQAVTQLLMDIEVSQILDANRYERSTTRRAYRNGYRTTLWNSPIGQINLRIPKLRRGTYYPDRILNDAQLAQGLSDLIQLCMIYGVDRQRVTQNLAQLNFVSLSSYEVHQLCDVLQLYCKRPNTQQTLRQRGSQPANRHVQKEQAYTVLMQQRNAKGQLEIIDSADASRKDEQFWKDFTRRMSHMQLLADGHQSILSSINPYALLEVDDSASIHKSDLALHIHTLYDEEYQLIA